MNGRQICTRCQVAIAKPTGRWCQPCYDTGEAARIPADAVAQHIRTLRRNGVTLTDIADATGCSWRALSDIARGKTAGTRQWIADAVLAYGSDDDPGCRTCDDIRVALFASDDPQAIADRLGTTPGALARHAYRCGRPEWGRLFNKPVIADRYARTGR